ncbi:MAG TPA: hypothetical protein VHC69_11395 [Polyangiaceae bacterium]|nr:hypothetical protein [Polyangiaceae bacterium]
MYVANSDFDLQFNAGSVQVYDLEAIRNKVPVYCNDDTVCTDKGYVSCDLTGKGTASGGKDGAPTHRCVDKKNNPCAAAGTSVQSVADQSFTPGLCAYLEPAPLLYGGVQKGTVAIGAFATDLLYATNPLKEGKGARLFVPVRGDATLHWITVDDDTSADLPNGKSGVYPDGSDHSTGVALDCGQSGPTNTCDENHRRGQGTNEAVLTDPTFNLPPEPFGVALQARRYGGMVDTAGSEFMAQARTPVNPSLKPQMELPDGGLAPDAGPSPAAQLTDTQDTLREAQETLVTTHQTTGEVALFLNKWSIPPNADDGPELLTVAGGLPSGALAVASVPLPAFWVENQSRVNYQPSYLMTFTNAAQLTLLRTFDDSESAPPRPFVDASRSIAITTNASGFESRGVAIDNSARQACEAPVGGTCDPTHLPPDVPDRPSCLIKYCIPIPYDVYVANRSPASLVIGQTPPNVPNTLTDDLPRFYRSVPTSAGPSRVFVGNIIDKSGNLSRRVFVICFDSRRIFVYDPVTPDRFETEIVTGRGPHAFALDSHVDPDDPTQSYAYAYLGHFTDSYIGVIDLNQQHTQSYGTIVLSIGQRTAPRASK